MPNETATVGDSSIGGGACGGAVDGGGAREGGVGGGVGAVSVVALAVGRRRSFGEAQASWAALRCLHLPALLCCVFD